MAQVTITNLTGNVLLIQELYREVKPGESFTVTRYKDALRSMPEVYDLWYSGKINVSLAPDVGEDEFIQFIEPWGATPSGSASGDLSGNYPGPVVSGLQNRPVDSSAPAFGDSLVWDGSKWKPAAGGGGGGGITQLTGDVAAGPGLGSVSSTVGKIQGYSVSSSAPSVGYSLVWDGSQWAPTAPLIVSFRYTATGGESDFFVALPTARANDTYKVSASCAGVSSIVGIDLPDILAADRTTTQFRVITSLPLTAGDQIDFIVCG